MSDQLGLNEYHYKNILHVLRFTRFQNAQSLKTVQSSFQDVKSSFMRDETTFTVDEVNDLLKDLLHAVSTEAELEFLNLSHTTVLLLVQMFHQAEKWHLKLIVDVGELENRSLLDQVREFEEMELLGKGTGRKQPLLTPIMDGSASDLLRAEISRLQDEIVSMNGYVNMDVGPVVLAKGDGLPSDKQKISELEKELAKTNHELEAAKSKDKTDVTKLESSVADAKHELLKITSMLELAETELAAKVSDTTPFRNLQLMLKKKNDQVKRLRRRLIDHGDTNFDDDVDAEGE